MKVSLNSIRAVNARYTCCDDIAAIGVDALLQKIGAQLGAIEDVATSGKKYEGAVVAKVMSCSDHPNADRLHVCTIDDGGITQGVNRDASGYVQVVCGAPNVREGLLVVWLPPGATVPETYGKEPFVLTARDLRGVVSNGMLASPRELALGTSHEGILEIIDPFGTIKPGDSFGEAFGLQNDTIIDIENKMFTHRPDCFGMLGISRELAGIQGMPFTSPDWYRTDAAIPGPEAEELPLEVHCEIPELVPRFMAVTLRDVQVGPSPTWLQVELAKVGIRSINNIVDYTNFFMHETGQPLHAYDYDKVKALSGGDKAVIVVRYPKPGEKLLLLNGKEVEPRAEAIMIATDTQAIGLGGVMGGGETEVDERTRNVILECATFDMYSIRRTSMAHGLFTDAVTRFNKGQSPLQNRAVLAKIVDEIRRFAAGKVAGSVIDDNHVAGREWVHPPVMVSAAYINARLGLQLSAEDMKRLLENVEFKVAIDGSMLTVTAPFWRTDIELREDVVEEVGRLYGYDHLPLVLPTRTIEPSHKDALLELKSRVRENLVKGGANEVLTYSFVHGNLLDKVGQDKSQAFQISNAISPELQYYRMSLTPSLLDKIHANVKAGYDKFALFEMGMVHHRGVMDETDVNVPLEDVHLGFIFAATDKALPKGAGADYYEARKYLNTVLPDAEPLLVPLNTFDFKGDIPGMQLCAPYEPNRSAVIVWNNLAWGVVGEFKPSVAKALKLPAHAAGFEVGLEVIGHAHTKGYQALPRFPKVEQDICLKVSSDTAYRQVYDFVWRKVDELKSEQTKFELSPLDIYQREDDREHKQITLRLSIASYEETMTDDEVAKLLDGVAAAAKDTLHAERV